MSTPLTEISGPDRYARDGMRARLASLQARRVGECDVMGLVAWHDAADVLLGDLVEALDRLDQVEALHEGRP